MRPLSAIQPLLSTTNSGHLVDPFLIIGARECCVPSKETHSTSRQGLHPFSAEKY